MAELVNRPRTATEAGPDVAPPVVHDVLRSPGRPLDEATQTSMSRAFGHDFSHVRVHTDARAAQAAGSVHANAFTVGSHIVFGRGEYHPTGGERVDVGHLLLAVDALLHPRTSAPYTTYNVPNIDPANWVADVGIASVWMTRAEEGKPHDDVPRNPSPPSADEYFRMSAPTEDLLGDIDAFRLEQQWREHPGTLSAALRRFYLGGPNSRGVDVRFQTFCAREGFRYQYSGGAVTWDASWRRSAIERIDRFNDLYAAGGAGIAWGVVAGQSHRAWPRTGDMLDRFLAWLKPRLEAELSRQPAGRR